MKKNKMMRFASLLLVVVLITTCAISGTFAKYTTDGKGSDSARVAAFGISVSVASDLGLFSTQYNGAGDNTSTVTVKASDSSNVIAPGTEGELAAAIITDEGREVAVSITTAATLELGEDSDWTITGEDGSKTLYCPLVITVGENTYSVSGSASNTYDSISAFEEAVNAAASGAAVNVLGVDESIDDVSIDSISWSWDFDADGAGTNDYNDTQLGTAESAANVSLTYSVTVAQVD